MAAAAGGGRCNWAGVAAVLIMMMMMSAVPEAVGAIITCSQVTSDVFPCISYASSGEGTVPPACCAGVNTLNNVAQSTPDRQFVCNCLKQLVRSLNVKFAANIPVKCGLSLPYKIDPNIDCSTVI